jgi:hypothetical protein
MTGEECIAHLKAENAALRAEVKALRKQLARILVLRRQPEGRSKKDSHKSSKPPSTDGPTHKTHSQLIPGGRKSGSQQGRPGHTLLLVEQPDEVFGTVFMQRCHG